MVLLCAGAASSLAAVWALAGLSERSGLRATPRVLAAAGLGVLGLGALHWLAPGELRGELALPALFGVACVLSLAAGAAKLEAALAERDGARALRRATGLVAGTFLGMAAVAAVSLELVVSSLSHARFGWSYVLPLVAAALVVFARRGGLAGAGALSLGRRGLVLGLAAVVLLGLARLVVGPKPVAAAPGAASAEPSPGALSAVDAAAVAPSLAPSPSVAAVEAVSSAAAPEIAPAAPGELQVEGVVSRGMLEADARGGVQRRFDRLQACLAEPKNQQSGALTLRVGISGGGSVRFVRASGGELVGTPLAACLLPLFYKMGFAAPASSDAGFDITLRAPPR